MGQPLQGQPIGFAFVPHDLGMGGAEDDVDHVRMAGQNGGQSGNNRFDPFVC